MFSYNRYEKILVANRGEIAIRILRAASELNLKTVAIYTYEDRYSLHRYKADESYQIGEDDSPLKPYLDIETILRTAKRCNADAIHPGYGFLSENEEFASRCKEEGIIFIGPDASVMNQLGDKIEAKKLARKVGVPVIEDSKVDLLDEEILKAEVEKIGMPVVIKAAAGGGGRGMRVVRDKKKLVKLWKEAKGEAATAFGNSTVFVEKFIENPKHIEVQLLGDKHGHLIHLYERDCSVQRRFQKVVEIAPCLTLSEKTKHKLYDYAIRLGEAVNYTHAGTVEFLVDPDENVYFIEVNPRIQVEHTITEEITGIDIVRAQILISMGFELGHELIRIYDQDSVQVHGCAIQCRITTEDPNNNFKPDYGRLIAYRSASGFGIRLDAGSAYSGTVISPFFDSMLVKVTAWGRTMNGTASRLHRALREFRIRGVKTNIKFLLNLLQDETFYKGKATVNFIEANPHLLVTEVWKDRGTKTLRYLAETIVNGNTDVKSVDLDLVRNFKKPRIPHVDPTREFPSGTKDSLIKLGREAFLKQIKDNPKIQYTDTTMRDAHQSLLATRMRTFDLLNVAESFAKTHGDKLFSMEVWGGATYDVSMRFLKECPWERLHKLRKAMPNVLLQMLLRGSNAVGYTAYPDNLIIKFIEESAQSGIDVFRIFDSLNWVENMKVSIQAVHERTESIAEACICYTGDVSNPQKSKYDLQYYLDLARELEDAGAHILAIKDMAGLLKPKAAEILIPALKEVTDLPIHLHTHDTSSLQAATLMKAIENDVDIIDVALASMSGLTSQPNFNSIASMMSGHERDNEIDIESLNEFSHYWESIRPIYYPFEAELTAGTAEVYNHEIPGGQYSNLRPQARGLGLEDQFETIKKNYISANELFGDIVKVTPSSKVVGDLAMFMTANKLSKADVLAKGNQLAFPESVKALMRGELGQTKGGFPKEFQEMVLKGEKPFTDRANAHMKPIDFENELKTFKIQFPENIGMKELLSYQLYPKVFTEYKEFRDLFGDVSVINSPTFFYGMYENEELMIQIDEGKTIAVKYLYMSAPDDAGIRRVFFELNGQNRSVKIRDKGIESTVKTHVKATDANQIGAPLQGSLSKILVNEGDKVEKNTPLFIIEAMKMESVITAVEKGEINMIYLKEKTMVEQDDLVLDLK